MFSKTFALSAAALLLSGAAFAAPGQGKKAAAKPKLVVINTCPMTGENSTKAGGGSEVVGKYRVSFCCPSCKPQFDKLSKAEKEKKVAALAKKAAKSTSKSVSSLIEINTCPIMGSDSTGGKGGSSVVGKYKVNFCCGGCKPQFDKLTQAEKEKKVAELAKKS